MADSPSERRGHERRGGTERRRGRSPRAFLLRLIHGERRKSGQRRSESDRRTARQTATDLVRGAFEFIASVCQSDAVTDEEARHQLDSALVRLKFALERLESGGGH
jgi:hypothetical protein